MKHPHSNGSPALEIGQADMGGWVRVYPAASGSTSAARTPDLPENLPWRSPCGTCCCTPSSPGGRGRPGSHAAAGPQAQGAPVGGRTRGRLAAVATRVWPLSNRRRPTQRTDHSFAACVRCSSWKPGAAAAAFPERKHYARLVGSHRQGVRSLLED
jgi:hypothetical protein